MTPPDCESRADRLLRRLLTLYPSAFRRQYGEEMESLLRERHADARARGVLTSTFSLGAAVWSTLLNAVAVRIEQRPLGAWASDLRFAWINLRRRPGIGLLAIAVLAAAVGASTAVFSLVNGTLLRPPRFGASGRTVIVWGSNPYDGQVRDVVAGSTFVELERAGLPFERMAALQSDDVTLRTGTGPANAGPEVISALAVTTGFFEILGVAAERGRVFNEAERSSGGQSSVVLSHAFWRDRFGSAADIVGRPLRVDDSVATVIGVLPASFGSVFSAAVYLPLYRDVIAQDSHTHFHYWVLGTLRQDATLTSATEALGAGMARIIDKDPRLERWSVLVEPMHATSVEAVRPILWALFASVGLVMLVAIANLANLLLLGGARRSNEIATRVALGASRARVVRMLMLEGISIGALGAVGGLALAATATGLLPALLPDTIPIPGSAARVQGLHLNTDWTVAAAGAAAALLASIAFSLPTALRAVRSHQDTRSGDRARTDTRAARRTFDALVVAEIGLATVMVLAAAVAVASLGALTGRDSGVRPEGVMTMYFASLHNESPEQRADYYRQVLARVAEVPGVQAVGVSDYVPFENEDDFEGIVFEDRPRPRTGSVREEWRRVSVDYFRAAGIELQHGRTFVPDDFDTGPSVAVVNASFAARHYADGRDPVGQHVEITSDGYRRTEIVGIVADVLARGLSQEAPPIVYVPYHRNPRPLMAMFVRGSGSPHPLTTPVREAIWSVDSSQPIHAPRALSDILAGSVGIPRLARTVLSALAVGAAALAFIGVLGVVGYAVGQREREFGVRLALGATSAGLQRRVLLRTAALAATAASFGLTAGVIATTVTQGLWYGVSPVDPLLLAITAAGVIATSLVAAALPARAIGRIAPAQSLRS